MIDTIEFDGMGFLDRFIVNNIRVVVSSPSAILDELAARLVVHSHYNQYVLLYI